MTFQELCKIVEDYANRYKCDVEKSIDDLEFDGPDGSFGPDADDVAKLRAHFGIDDGDQS